MRKLFFLSCFFINSISFGQFYSSTEGQKTKDDGYYVANFSEYTWGRFGIFLYTSRVKGYTDIAPGIALTSNAEKHKKLYWELGAGPGVSFPDPNLKEKNYTYLQVYGWMENKPSSRYVRNKVILQVNPAYTFDEAQPWWWLGYALYSPAKWLDIGGYYMTDGPQGARIGINIPLGKTVLLKPYVVAGKKNGIGMQLVIQ